jgi:hypothetical protein
MPFQPPIAGAADDAAEAHIGRCILKKAMALESQLLQI